MQNKFSTFLAISGLVMLTSSTPLCSVKNDEHQGQRKKEVASTFIQSVNTDKRTVAEEWNAGCNNCRG